MSYKLIDNKIFKTNNTEKYSLVTSQDILNSLVSDGKLCTEIKAEIQNISFDTGYFVSSIKARIYVPSDNKKLHPVLQFIAIDNDYHEYNIDTIPEDYLILNNHFIVFDNDQLLDLKKAFKSIKSGVIYFGQLAKSYTLNLPELEYVIDDARCVEIEETLILKTSTGIPLFPYQVTGVRWLNDVMDEGVGCILADEMGLGKTLQVIEVLAKQRYLGVSLIICPNSLMENWRREIEKFEPELKVYKHAGKNRDYNTKGYSRYDVVITSYDTAVNDFSVLQNYHWNILVLDEAQAIKNDSKRSNVIRAFTKRAGLAVSGTPYENHLTDVWSLYDFCFRGLLGTLSEFKKLYNDTTESAEHLEKVISPLLLRRLVKNVKNELPEKIIIPVPLEMSSLEALCYENIRSEYKSHNDSNKEKMKLGLLNRLRFFCIDPISYARELSDKDIGEVSEKFVYFISLLDDIYSSCEKVIVFISCLKMQEQIKERVENRYDSKCFILNGSVSVNERQNIVDEFSKVNGFSVMLLNPTVGGTGLNITAANHVIFYSLEWNPALQNQCIARAFRNGQNKVVTVHMLFYVNTVEEVINERLSKKKEVNDVLVAGTDGEEKADIERALQMSPFYNLGDRT